MTWVTWDLEHHSLTKIHLFRAFLSSGWPSYTLSPSPTFFSVSQTYWPFKGACHDVLIFALKRISCWCHWMGFIMNIYKKHGLCFPLFSPSNKYVFFPVNIPWNHWWSHMGFQPGHRNSSDATQYGRRGWGRGRGGRWSWGSRSWWGRSEIEVLGVFGRWSVLMCFMMFYDVFFCQSTRFWYLKVVSSKWLEVKKNGWEPSWTIQNVDMLGV